MPGKIAAAPSFRLPAASGGVVSIEDFRGKVHVVLVFLRSRN